MRFSEITDNTKSHLPVLANITKLLRVINVLEIGFGKNSSPLFLDKVYYPDLINLDSYETNQNYANEIMSNIKDDRLHLHISTDRDMDISKYDLVFIDDGCLVNERVSTISSITQRNAPNTLIVIHDFEQNAYRSAVNDRCKQYSLEYMLPYTGLVWQNDEFWNIEKCKELGELSA